MFANVKVFHHLGEKSHNLNKLNNNAENNLSSIQKEQTVDVMFTNAKVLHHLGEESHNLNKLNNNTENKVKFHTKGTVDVIYGQFDQYEQPF